MPTLNRLTSLIAFSAVFLTGCYIEDPGPRQTTERSYSVVDFDRLEIGSGLHVNVEYGELYSVTARGDRRNVDDLIVEKEGSTLVVRYSNSRQRRHDTFINVTSPELYAVTFSGGSDSKVAGFTTEGDFDVNLSGGSLCQMVVHARRMGVVLSGGSSLNLRGEGEIMEADISGASSLRAFNFPLAEADMHVTGASDAQVSVGNVLQLKASGASHIVYRGTPSVTSDVSGGSSVQQESN